MEGNKDEALKCRRLAEKYLGQGDEEKAIKFLKKADRLYPTKQVKELLNSLLKNGMSGGFEKSDKTDGVRHRTRTNSGGSASNSAVEKNYTSEQVEAVKKVKGCKDYYEILGVSRDSTEADIKKQYRKLALQISPR
ncbi:hypothetical protein QZH41_011916 [Actinostola sp. cb2023]|nr:hypothetical protein QZH41_011916 [Actinostola sp. cb2023]